MDDSFLLSDGEVAEFIVKGYHLVEPELPAGLNESIADQLDALDHNPGDAITEAVPELWQVLDHPQVKGALISLLGHEYEVQSHRHWHCKQPHSGHMNWHQDGLNNRDTLINRFLGLYYPTDITPDMGPTVIVPGTQFRNAPTDRMAHYTNIRGQVPLVVKAGTVAFTHYDLWHGTAANRSDHKRRERLLDGREAVTIFLVVAFGVVLGPPYCPRRRSALAGQRSKHKAICHHGAAERYVRIPHPESICRGLPERLGGPH
ncbi:phytanoyl-CoA dioxygenase family protein [uncultured Salinisphaera sp.]|uniref:phytanoyl-CoA dioxygenase family protein n=1 Tax=uncultured Salinisphaera sp. TaxID=359372 RepID=UPI0032B25184